MEKDHVVTDLLRGDAVVGETGACGRRARQLVVVRREERARADHVVQVLGDRPRDRQAVEGRRAATDLVEDDERAPRRVAQDGGVSRISTMNVDSPRDRLSRGADAGEDAIARRRSRADRAGTNEPICASSTISATWRMYVDLPAMFGPVMTSSARRRARQRSSRR